MATAEVMPAPPTAQPNPVSVAAPGVSAEQALMTLSPEPEDGGSLQLSKSMARLPVELDISVAVREFRVRNLLALEPGQVIETLWSHGKDVPLAAGQVQLAWSEFEVVDTQLAVRITRLA
jgi:flagellar motor switch/type III secretory pathway protein FliN